MKLQLMYRWDTSFNKKTQKKLQNDKPHSWTFKPFFFIKGMSQKYKLLYYLKQVYVGGFSSLQTGLLKMYIHSVPVGGAFGTSEI